MELLSLLCLLYFSHIDKSEFENHDFISGYCPS